MDRFAKGISSGGGCDGGGRLQSSFRLHAKEFLKAKMERYLEKKSDSIKVEVIELEHFLLGPENAEFGITFFRREREG